MDVVTALVEVVLVALGVPVAVRSSGGLPSVVGSNLTGLTSTENGGVDGTESVVSSISGAGG